MKRLLLIGDLHVPNRAHRIPDWIHELLERERFDFVLCTGDLVSKDVYDFLNRVGNAKIVRGNMDTLPLPDMEILTVEGKRIGLMHGTGIYPRGNMKQLYEVAKKHNLDILVHGHTHKLDVRWYKDVLFLNPGTATGSWGGSSDATDQTLIVLEIDNDNVNVIKFVNGERF